MLNKQDLTSIRKVVREEVENETKIARTKLETDVKMSRIMIQSSLNQIEDRIKNIEISNSRSDKIILKIQEDVKKIIKDLAQTSDFLDKDNMVTLKRVNRIERFLHLPEVSFA